MPLAPLSPVRLLAPLSRPQAASPASAPPAPVVTKPQLAAVQAPRPDWTAGRIAKTAGVGVGGFVGGGAATMVADLFFHLGNNGGTAWPGGIYLMVAGLAAAGAMALYARAGAK
ncbi:MAG: hypothetical protein VKP62_04560 [Candidatus Sericytochromatia bacterium]|nr:hypothetical protein [Candidatus Sericytochromatia bacterium]